jgi:hypothetical protein
VSRSSGGPSRARLGISAAAWYLEMHINWGLYGLIFAILVAPWLFQWAVDHNSLESVLTRLASNNGLAAFDVVVAGALGVGAFASDLSEGVLQYALEGPLRRRDAWLAKAALGSATIVAAVAVAALGTIVAALSTGGGPLGADLLRVMVMAGAELSLFLTALALCGAMRWTVAAVVATVWVLLPYLLAALVVTAAGRPLPAVTTVLTGLSPVGRTVSNGAGPTVDALLHVVWFLAWGIAMSLLALRWWERAALERLGDTVFFPAVWGLYYALYALTTAIVVVAVLSHHLVGLACFVAVVAVFAGSWLVWRRVLGRRPRRAAPNGTPEA